MKKVLAFGLVFFCLCGVVRSQAVFNILADTLYQGCDSTVNLNLFADSLKSDGYTYEILPYSTEPVGGTSLAMNDDQVLGPFPVGFDISWYCGNYNQLYIGSNGYISFQATGTAWNTVPLPSTAFNIPLNSVMGVWRDWNPGTGVGPYVTYQTVGTAPNRKLIVSWTAVPMFSCGTSLGTFQIVVHETSNIIHTNITNMPVCFGWNNGEGVHSTHDPTGTIAVTVAGRNNTPFTTTNESIRFIPTSPIIWTNANNDTLGIGNDLNVSLLQSQYVYASGITCNNTSGFDSVFVNSSCILLITDSIDVDCTGDSTGVGVAIDTSLSTIPPYTFEWLDANNTVIATHVSADSVDSLINLPAGTYSIRVTDGSSNLAVGSVTINEPDTIAATTSSLDVLCNGESTGTAIATDNNSYLGLNWDGLYSYEWSDNLGTIISFTTNSTSNINVVQNLPIGTYNVTVDGCFIQTGSVTISEPTEVVPSISGATPVSCPGTNNCDASATGNGSGGVPPYTYQWSSGELTQTASMLCPGLNYLTVTDANGCDTIDSVDIAVPAPIVTTTNPDTMICITNSASIVGASSGGTSPYTYVWTIDSLAGAVVSTNSNDLVSPVTTKRYFVSSTDANGCPGDTSNILIRVRPKLFDTVSQVDTICPYDIIDLSVQGFGGDTNYTYSWSEGGFGSTITVSPDTSTTYFVTIADQCGTPPIVDSIYVQVGGYSPLKASIRAEDDSICVGENIYLISTGSGGFRGPDEYRYEWSVNNWSGNPYQFASPKKTTSYSVKITDLCLSPAGYDTITVSVGKPVIPSITASPTISCTNADVTIKLQNFNRNFDYNWRLGDGTSSMNVQTDSLIHNYRTPGCYDVFLRTVTDYGCISEKSIPCLVNILSSPTANFTNKPSNPSSVDPLVEFYDQSINAQSIEWSIAGVSKGTEEYFTEEFIDSGLYEIRLIATSSDGCTDTITKNVRNRVLQSIFIPTSFSPNGDGLNDVFGVLGEAIGQEGYELVIFDRWGSRMFWSTNPYFGWDGSIEGSGMAPIGTYAYTLRYIDRYKEKQIVTGQVVISKSSKSNSTNN